MTQCLGSLPGWSKWQFFTTQKASLGNVTPLVALSRGKLDEVERAAMAFVERQGAHLLAAPGEHFASATLVTREVVPAALVRISRFATGEPYFGKSGGNRFDDPRKRRRYGTRYFGVDLHCAFAETVLHDEVADLVLFDRAAPKRSLNDAVPCRRHPHAVHVLRDFNVLLR